jgi:hypothetical protein
MRRGAGAEITIGATIDGTLGSRVVRGAGLARLARWGDVLAAGERLHFSECKNSIFAREFDAEVTDARRSARLRGERRG